MNEHRWTPRYATKKDVTAILTVDGEKLVESNPIDISCGGAYLKVAKPNTKNARIVLTVPEPFPDKTFKVERECNILEGRAGADGCAIRFDQALSGEALAKFAADSSTVGSLNLARTDYTEVFSEINSIQTCRSQVFLGTLAAIAAWVAGAIALVVTNKLVSIGIWTLFGAVVPYVLLTIAVLISIEKSRALNVRRGFLAALTEYLRHDTAPPNYHGWAHLRITVSECRARMAAKLCPHEDIYCWEEERNKHGRLTSKKHPISNLLDSFTALSAAVYAAIYVITVGIMIYASLLALAYSPNAATTVALIEGAAVFGMALFLLKQLYADRKGKHSVEAQLLMWRAALRHCRPLGME